LRTTRFGRRHANAIGRYIRLIPAVNRLKKHRAFAENPLYGKADALIKGVTRFIRRHHGNFPWLERWYEYV
jgi:hypothetical protein